MQTRKLGNGAEVIVQVVRFAVQQFIHKLPVRFLLPHQRRFAGSTLKLVQQRDQGVSASAAVQFDFLGPVGTDDQDPAVVCPLANVVQQADGAEVRPMQIVQHQQEGPFLGQRTEHPSVLLEQVLLLERGDYPAIADLLVQLDRLDAAPTCSSSASRRRQVSYWARASLRRPMRASRRMRQRWPPPTGQYLLHLWPDTPQTQPHRASGRCLG
jgi:hypothetical protein